MFSIGRGSLYGKTTKARFGVRRHGPSDLFSRMTSSNQSEIEACNQLREQYNRLALLNGYSPKSVSFRCWRTIERRFQVLFEGFENFQSMRVLDFGCGVGHLYGYLKRQGFQGEYLGLDVSEQMIEVARTEHPDGRFECRNLLSEPFSEKFDLAITAREGEISAFPLSAMAM